jgi:hypothetical protein
LGDAMNWEAAGAVGEIIGAIAVVATLIYFARQLGQATREQQIAAIRANRNERREFFEALRDSPYIPAILCKVSAGEALSTEENVRLLTHNAALWAVVFSEWVQSQLGLSGEYATSNEAIIALHLSQPGAAEWFQGIGREFYPPRFVADVERIQQALNSQ